MASIRAQHDLRSRYALHTGATRLAEPLWAPYGRNTTCGAAMGSIQTEQGQFTPE